MKIVARDTLPEADERWEPSAKMICDLADADAFVECYRKPHVPVMSAFGGGRLHAFRLYGSWDLTSMVSKNAEALFRSVRKTHFKNGKETTEQWDDLTFRFGTHSFVFADPNRIIGFAVTSDEARNLAFQFGKAFPATPASGGTFYLIEQTNSQIKCHAVTLPDNTILGTEKLELHYGHDGLQWHEHLIGKLRNKNHGLSILEGKPGTGKTSYIRHLMGALGESHLFYFIPASHMGVLSKAEFAGFWAEQRQIHADWKFVAVLEDADTALMTRGTDNREQVSAILNLSDGLLADFLRLQIICTINCSAADIDPALLRPGRLLSHRVFNRLDHVQAARLAERLGKKLPAAKDYSLAEIFAGDEQQEISRPRIGFATSRK